MDKLGEPLATMMEVARELDSANSNLEQQTQYVQQQAESVDDIERREKLEKIAHNLEELERRYKEVFGKIDKVRTGMENSK